MKFLQIDDFSFFFIKKGQKIESLAFDKTRTYIYLVWLSYNYFFFMSWLLQQIPRKAFCFFFQLLAGVCSRNSPKKRKTEVVAFLHRENSATRFIRRRINMVVDLENAGPKSQLRCPINDYNEGNLGSGSVSSVC